ncbi:MAG TPA: MMPL family transporter [Methanomassiliicoccales archaeon]|jgi:RND superfamily putative drug exporter
MIFDKLANVVTRRYKLIIAIWIVALLVAIPAMLNVSNAVSYNTDMTAGQDNESLRVAQIVEKDFQNSVANSTLIIVLQSNNMTDAQSRDFVLELQKRLETSPNILYLEGTSSIYTYSETVLQTYITQLGAQMRPVESQINQSAFMIWGIPALHASNWAATGSDSEAYNITIAQLRVMLSNYDANISAMALGYYGMFAATWNSTASDSSLANPMVRATFCVNNTAPMFIKELPVEAAQKKIMFGVVSKIDLTTFSNPTVIRAFTLNAIGTAAGITDMAFLQQVYDLGPIYDPQKVAEKASSIVSNGTLATYPVAMPQKLLTSFVSPSNQTMLVMMSFSKADNYTDEKGNKPILEDVDKVRGIISDLKSSSGSKITTYVTGTGAISQDMSISSKNDMALIEPITIIIIIVLMGYLFRTVLGQFLPLGAVGVAIGLSQALIYVLGTTLLDINYMISTILFAILMGVGTDYSIFIITRYREERIKGATREQAVHTSVVWAGESIVTSAATVVIALLAMATANFSFVQSMGIVLCGAIVIALLIALTLVPSILMLVGNRIFWPTTGERWKRFATNLMERKKAGNHGYFHRAATFSVRHAKVIVIAAVLVTLPTTYLFITADTSFDFIGAMGDSESINGMKAMSNDFGAGSIQPTQVVISGTTVIYDGTNFNLTYLDAVDNITASIASESMVQKVTSITRPYGDKIDYYHLSALPEEERAQIVSGMLQGLGKDNSSVMLTIVLKEQPQSADSVGFIPTLRNDINNAKLSQVALSSSTIQVGGSTASLYDMSQSTSKEFTNIEIMVVVGIFIVLMVVLGSLLLPAFAVISIAMSITWSFTLTSFLFGSVLDKPVLWLVPLILFVLLMGIGMDYNVFILTRIREEIHKGKDTEQAVVDAVDWTGGIITALALIMAGAFGAMMISSNSMLQEFGFALTVAVLLDAMVVRTYIVPAALTLMGKKAWWAPGWLQREGRKEKAAKKQ